ncbi:hypothetical protein ACVWZ4_001000 [Bradyrhizobium sp. USDA 4472]
MRSSLEDWVSQVDGAAFSYHSDEEPGRLLSLALRLDDISNFIRHIKIAATGERLSRNVRLDQLSSLLFNYQFRRVVRGDGYMASVTNERAHVEKSDATQILPQHRH